VRVHYAWHPAFGSEVDVLYREARRGEDVHVCVRPDGSGVVIPSWMFDSARCGSMVLVTRPHPSLPVGLAIGLAGLVLHGLLVHDARDDQAPVSAALEGDARGLLDPDALELSFEQRVRQLDAHLGQITLG